MVSRKDVALQAGVSQASVSYYINNSGYVSADAKKRIQKAIDKLGYRPNQMAKNLRSQSNKQFVFFCNEIRNPFYSQLVYQATRMAIKQDYIILFSSVVDDDDYISKICGYQISGVFASNNRINSKIINTLASQNIPVVILRDVEWSDINPKITQIKIDYKTIMSEIIAHLKKNHYKKFHYISSSLETTLPAEVKTAEFVKAANSFSHSIVYGISDTRRAYEYIINNRDAYKKNDAIICANDAVAFGARKAITEIGLRIPDDIAIVGFDNTTTSEFSIPGITTIDIETANIGEIIISLLMKKIQGEKVPDYIIKPKLIVRSSSTRILNS